jgi:hypothetical protein
MTLAAVAVLLALTQAPAGEPPNDFAVHIVFGQCWNESVDTARRVFTRTIRPGVSRTARVELTPQHRRRLHALVVEADLFGYPPTFEPVGGTTVEVLPHSDFRIEVRSNGRSHVIEWVDHLSLHPDANRLRAMLRSVRALFLELPAVQRLPPSQMFCL